jgi:transposase InsO family protein
MPRPVPLPIRSAIARRVAAGDAAADIAAALGRPARTLRRLVRRCRLTGQLPGPDYSRCGRPLGGANQALRQRALDLRKLNPRWGARLIQAVLPVPDGVARPSASTVARWLRRAGLAPAPRGRPAADRPRPACPHERWQMDACEELPLADGSYACWLRLVDVFSGAILGTALFAARRWAEVAPGQVQAALRSAFARWGLPDHLQADNGAPWGASGGLLTALALWVTGLGVDLDFIAAGQPQENGCVERSHGVSQGWYDTARRGSFAELQALALALDEVQRARYPVVGALSRVQAYPALLSPRRVYDPSAEEQTWRLRRALEALAERVVQRVVGQDGRVSLYDWGRYVGRAHRGRTVYVHLEPDSQEWAVRDQQGNLLKRLAAAELSAQDIRGLTVSRPR